MKKIAVVLSGCGYKDGSEITEAVSTLIALTETGAHYEIFAPNINAPATNHLTQKPEGERSVLAESARIARGKVSDIINLKAKSFDGIVFPGGYGAANNLSTFGTEGAKGSVHSEVKRVVQEFHNDSKPICAICIAPAMIALLLGSQGVTVTIGNDKGTSDEIKKTGAQHEDCNVDDYVTDRENKVITTPAYMYDEAKPSDVFKGVRGAVRELVEMA